MKNSVLPRFALLGLLASPFVGFACTPTPQEDPDSNEGGLGGEGGAKATGGATSETGGAASGGVGSESSMGGSGTGGSPAKDPQCVPYPEGLALFFNQAPFDDPIPESLFMKSKEVISGLHASVNSESYGTSTGPVGMAINFKNDVSVTRDSPIDGGPAPWLMASYEFWVKTSDSSANLLSFFSEFSPGNSYWRTELGSDGRVEVHITGDEDGEGPLGAAVWSVYSTSSVNDGKPHHVVIVHDLESTRVLLYIDGKSEADVPLAEGAPMEAGNIGLAYAKAIQAETHPLVLGGNARNHFFAGQIDEVSLYTTRLSAATVKALHEAGSAGKCVD